MRLTYHAIYAHSLLSYAFDNENELCYNFVCLLHDWFCDLESLLKVGIFFILLKNPEASCISFMKSDSESDMKIKKQKIKPNCPLKPTFRTLSELHLSGTPMDSINNSFMESFLEFTFFNSPIYFLRILFIFLFDQK